MVDAIGIIIVEGSGGAADRYGARSPIRRTNFFRAPRIGTQEAALLPSAVLSHESCDKLTPERPAGEPMKYQKSKTTIKASLGGTFHPPTTLS